MTIGGRWSVAACFLGSMLVIDTIYSPPMWLQMVIWMPVMTAIVLGMMRPFKGVLITLQFHHKAGQGQQAQAAPKPDQDAAA